MAENGWSISDALDELGIYGPGFYADLTRKQKAALEQLKEEKRNTKKSRNPFGELHEFFTTNEYA